MSTRTVAQRVAPPSGSAGGSAFTGTAALLRLALRRDRVLVPAWVLTFAGMATFSARATVGLYPDVADRLVAAEAVNGSAALVALYGRIYDPTSLGELSLFKMTAFGAALVGVLLIQLVVRHTRAEEESGRLELLGAGVVGRDAPLAAAMLLALVTTGGIALLTGLGLASSGLPLGGSMAFGLAWGAAGMLFAAVAGITAQVTTGGRAARGMALVVLALAYVARAVGDLAEEGPGWLSWLSPIGWSQQVRAFSGTRWALLALPVVATAVLVPLAFVLRARRDLGGGFIADRPGPAHGHLGTPMGLAWRLQRPSLLAWAASTTLMGVVLGSIAHNVSGFFDSEAMQEFLELLGGKQGVTDMFLAAEVGLIGVILTAYGIAAAHWLGAEEESGRAENVLATAASRRGWVASHVVMAMGGVAALLVLMGLAVGVGHALAVGDAGQVPRIAAAALAQVPAAWVMVAAMVAVWGLWPRGVALVWALYLAFVLVGEFGELWKVPRLVADLSPFAHSPTLPGPAPDLGGIPWLLAAAAALVALGVMSFRRRDVVST